MYRQEQVGAVIAAAGTGQRFGAGRKKQFLEIGGKPIWIRTLEVLSEVPAIDSIVIAAPPEDLEEMRGVAAPLGDSKLKAIVAGGAHRQDSVLRGLEGLRKFNPDLILIHDAVRPLVSRKIIEDVIEGADLYKAAVPAVQPKETIKMGDGDSFVRTTPERASLYVIQTPQGFHAGVLFEAFERASKEHYYGTDDANLVERMGIKVRIVPGAYENLKITTPEDLAFAELLVGGP